VSVATEQEQLATRGWWWLLSFTAGGVLSAAYNIFCISSYRNDYESWSRINESITPIIHVFSYIAPIVDQSYRVVAATGDLKRAILVQHLYTIDWLICLVAGIGALPFKVQTCRATALRKAKITQYPNRELEHQQELGSGLLALAAVFMLWESWLCSFYGATSIFFNHVQVNDADLYRLCLFIPLTLLFGSSPVIDLCRYRKQRVLRKRGNT
jgi:hypothetical protein